VRIAAWARRRRSDGATLRELSRETGVCAESLRRWMAATNVAPTMVPIEVVTDRADARAGGLRLTTVAGHKIEGLTIADTIAIVRVLG
jgi:hypothetical protein